MSTKEGFHYTLLWAITYDGTHKVRVVVVCPQQCCRGRQWWNRVGTWNFQRPVCKYDSLDRTSSRTASLSGQDCTVLHAEVQHWFTSELFECKQLAGLFAKCLVSVCLKHLKVLWTESLHFDNVLCTQRLHLAFMVWLPIYLRHFITEVSVSKTASSFYGMVTNLFKALYHWSFCNDLCSLSIKAVLYQCQSNMHAVILCEMIDLWWY